MNRESTVGDLSPAPDLPTGRFEGRLSFQQNLRDALSAAALEGWREIIVCDPGFEDWPLGERSVVDSLNAWAGAGRKWTMLAGRYDEVIRRHARFVQWRRTWSHLIDCRALRSTDLMLMPSCLIGPGWAMRRLDVEHCTGVCSDEARWRTELQQDVHEWLRRSSPSFPSSVLGL